MEQIRLPETGQWTVAVDEDGTELGRWKDILAQVKEGNEFFIGQHPWIVCHIDHEDGDDKMVIYLRKP